MNHVEFPNLGLSFDISRVAFTIFGIDVYWYGVLIGIGMALAIFLAFQQAKNFGVDTDRMIDVIFIGFILAIVCGRLYYVFFVDSGIQYNSLWDIIDLRSGGIAIYGGIIGAVLGAIIGCKWRKVPLFPLLDLTAMGFLVGQAIGRWGNFFNQEAFGNNTSGIFGMKSETTVAYLKSNAAWLAEKGITVYPDMPVHPTFLYESVWCLVGFCLLWAYKKHRRFNGEIALLYVVWYGLGRFFIEGLRTDSLYIGGVRVSQLLAAASAVVAFAVWLYFRRKFAGKPLEVPAIPPRTAKVRLADDMGGEQWVTISWPADQRAPNKEEQQQLAKEMLRAEKTKAKDDPADTDKAKNDEAPGDTKASGAKPKAVSSVKKPEAKDDSADAEAPKAEDAETADKPVAVKKKASRAPKAKPEPEDIDAAKEKPKAAEKATAKEAKPSAEAKKTTKPGGTKKTAKKTLAAKKPAPAKDEEPKAPADSEPDDSSDGAEAD